MSAIRRFNFTDMNGRERNAIFCNDVPDMPHKSAAWGIERHETFDAHDGLICVSYNTVVADIEYLDDGSAILRVYGWYISATTRKHIRWFLDYIGVPLTVKEIKSIDCADGNKGMILYPMEYDRR